MTEPRNRRPNGASTIYPGADGRWHGRVTVGVREDGRGHLTRNVASIAGAPRLEDEEIEPYSVEEVKRLLEFAGRGRNGPRWALALGRDCARAKRWA